MTIKLSLHKNDPSRGVVLEFHAKNATVAELEKAEEFRAAVYDSMPRETGWFHQGGCRPDSKPSDWHLFEFWQYDRHAATVLEHSHAIALALGLPLHVGATLPNTGTPNTCYDLRLRPRMAGGSTSPT